MKVVLFCGGKGMRLREYSGTVPKPMVPIGYRPILWHVMKYYAHFGHKDFILCLGYQAAAIKEYFLNYDETVSNDFILSNGGKEVDLLGSDIDDWNITFVDTGLHTSVGERLMAIKPHLEGDDIFIANYADGLTDLHLPDMEQFFMESDSVASFIGVKPNQSFHIVSSDASGKVSSIDSVSDSNIRINGGYFILRKEIFDFMRPGDELVEAPFRRLIEENLLMSYTYDGFWACMDTFKEKQILDDLYNFGKAPWQVWRTDEYPGVQANEPVGRIA